jgi:hypothetical protein
MTETKNIKHIDHTITSAQRRRIVCLCGSTRFSQAFQKANFDETLAGRIVLTIGCDTKSDEGLKLTTAQKAQLDLLHWDKIELSHEILVLNVGGYIGTSTSREISFAYRLGKVVRYLEPMLLHVFEVQDGREICEMCEHEATWLRFHNGFTAQENGKLSSARCDWHAWISGARA